MPIDAEGEDDVFVGRIRQDASRTDRGVAMWLVVRQPSEGRGPELGIQIAEEMMKRPADLRETPGGR